MLVPDKRLGRLEELAQPQRTIPASVEFVDIAGLVKGASKGEGLGNAFLANIREAQALVQVVRCFESDEITHVSGAIDPIADVETINTELALADLETLERQIARRRRLVNSGNAEAKTELVWLEELRQSLDQGRPVRGLELGEEQLRFIEGLFLLTAKPMLYLANVDESSAAQGNAYSHRLTEYACAEGAQALLMCNSIEAEIAELDADSQQVFLRDLGLVEPGLNRLIRAGYSLLRLNTFFTAGKKELRAWTFPTGARAPDAAAVIHTDFQKGFIRAEVIGYDDYVACGGEQGAKEAGKWRLEGKDYLVRDGDVMHFRFNT